MKGKKIVPHAVAGSLVMILVWALGAFAKIAIPPEIAVAIGTVITVLVGIITPDEMEAE